MKHYKIKKNGRLPGFVYGGCKLSFKTRYLRKDRGKKLRKDEEEEEVSSYFTTLRKRNDTRN